MLTTRPVELPQATFTFSPTISNVSPASGPVGTACEIDGTGFCEGVTPCAAPKVEFNHTAASLTCDTTDTKICTSVPMGATSGDVCVKTGGGTACTPFTVTACTLHFVAGNFQPTTVGTFYSGSISLTGVQGSVTWSTSGGLPDGLTFQNGSVSGTPTKPGTYNFTITAQDSTGPGCAISQGVTITVAAPPAPNITSFSPTSGPFGTAVTVTGTNFTGATVVAFNGTSATFAVNSGTQISATVPNDATTGPITVTTAGGVATSSSSFTVSATVCPPTTITAIPRSATTDAEWNVDIHIDCPGGATYEISSGSLPRGVFISPGGLGQPVSLQGTPDQLGPSFFTITITCGTCKTSRTYDVTIKDPSQVTPTQQTFQVGDVSGSLSNVSASGQVTVAPRDPQSAGQLPSGDQLESNSVAFDVETTATSNGPVQINYKVPPAQGPNAKAVTDMAAATSPAAQLRLLHLEQGVLLDRTTDIDLATNTIHAQANSPGTFVIATSPAWEAVVLTAAQTEIKTWTIGGRTYAYLKLSFPNAGYRVANWGQAVRAGNDFSADAFVERFTGPSVQAVTTTAQIYDLGPLTDGIYNFNFKTSGTLAKTLQFTVSSATPPPNPIDTAREFVKQQYRDFLNREADQAGEDFWTDNITKCSDPARRPAGQTEAQCTLRQRETTSGAFFLSPEFQYTGYFVYRMYQGALGRQPKLSEFTPDAQFVGAGIVVNGQLSGAKINQNKADFAAQFVNCTDAAKYRCAEFKAIYDGLSNQQYVDALFVKTGANPSASERAALVNGLNGATETRASVLQKVVDGIKVISEGNQQFTTTYGQAFYNSEFNRAFVLLEYFGYMKRDPDDAGYAFWLGKLNQFGGNFVNAEMVLAFISSPEYRARFGTP